MDYPLLIDRVVLVVHDLTRTRAFYEDALGLDLLAADGESAILGAGSAPLVELRRDPGARRASPRDAGLYHTAFLLPSRAALGAWLRHAVARGIPLQGAADHGVSEALYLADPEGNGIEIYADRPESAWVRDGDRVAMATDPLDAEALMALPGDWRGAPADTVIGHLHLATGDVDAAAALFTGWGMVETMRARGGAWFGAGGYHHQLAANIWNSRGAGQRRFPPTGLAEYHLSVAPGHLPAPGLLHDADGTPVRVRERITP